MRTDCIFLLLLTAQEAGASGLFSLLRVGHGAILGIKKTDEEKVNGNMVGIKRKQRLSLGLGATKPIDHIRAPMVSRLAEIKAEVMCCMPTATVKHSRHAQSPGSTLPTTRVAAHGK